MGTLNGTVNVHKKQVEAENEIETLKSNAEETEKKHRTEIAKLTKQEDLIQMKTLEVMKLQEQISQHNEEYAATSELLDLCKEKCTQLEKENYTSNLELMTESANNREIKAELEKEVNEI